ncbi:MAG: GNAT family N-acetyltransferase [Sciscionella sp.]
MGELRIRLAQRDDLTELVGLCRAHADFDSAGDGPIAELPADLADRLAAQLFGSAPRLWCLVAHREDGLLGYASYCWHPSTWRGDDYIQMDCLFVAGNARGRSVGARLFAAGARRAAELGATRLQWQTPSWNSAAQRFYDRTGASSHAKHRYTLAL